ncbi:DUF3099 domain-containing protein [Cellulomonas sp. McL0617]|uniref:DUF3099 domain-containing protein n=1 Tax=Cellulomonas sp. McL0617 TaxID=3415675 RepID=UPI003CEA4E8E
MSSNRRSHDAPEGEVHRITTAPEPLTADMSRRESRYLIQMSIRVVCFLVAVLTWNHIPMWVSLVLLVAAVVLPYAAVLLANAGRERDDSGAAYLGPRELGGGDDVDGLGPAPTPGRGQEPDA